MKKILFYLSVLTLALVLFSSCGGEEKKPADDNKVDDNTKSVESDKTEKEDSKNTESDKENKETQKDLEKMSIVLDWYPNAIHGFIYNAIEKGYFAEEGIELEVLFPANPNDGISMPAAGKADFGIYYMKDVIKARADENVPVKSIGAILYEPVNVILSLKEKNITGPKDLEGKTIGYAGSDISKHTVIEMMKNSGADPKDVNFIDVGFELMSAMTTKQVDATIDCLENHEIPFMEKEGFEVNSFYFTDYGIPKYYEMIIVSGDETIKNKKDKVDGFKRAIAKGFEDMKKDKEGTLDILFKYQNPENFPLDRGVEEKSLDILLPKMETSENKFLSQKPEVWKENIEWMKSLGFLKNDIDSNEFIYE